MQGYVIEPELTGPEAYWEPCWPGAGSGEGPCNYMQATGSDTEPLNCAHYPLGRRAGNLVVRLYIPKGNATATVTYVLEHEHAATGEVTRFSAELRQADLSGWQELGRLRAYASSLSLTVCNNSAREGIRTNRWIDRLIGVDVASVTCFSDCISTGLHEELPGLVAAVYPDDKIALEWRRPRDDPYFLLAGYRVQYSTEGWRSPVYDVFDEFHYSPKLTANLEHEATVWAVDEFGRTGNSSRISIVLDPLKLLETDPLDVNRITYDTWDEEWVTDDDLRELRDWLDYVGILDPTPGSDSASGVLSIIVGDYFDAGFSAFAALVPYVGDVSKLRKVPKLVDAARLAKKSELVTGYYGPAKRLEGLNSGQRALVKIARRGPATAFNTTYKNGSKFKRDIYGRVVYASGDLKKTTIPGNLQVEQAAKDALQAMKTRNSDTMGHLVPDGFGGPFTVDNVVLQDGTVNAFINTNLEQAIWGPAVKSGTPVHVRLEVIYEEANRTMRPDQFRIHTQVGNTRVPPLQIDNVPNATPTWLH